MGTFTEQERVEILSNVVGCNTVNGNEKEVAEYFKELFEDHGIQVELDYVSENRPNLIATIGSGKPVIGISGHMDVVPAGDEEEWEYNPFELTESEGKLYGRGSSDMKSGLTALAIALIEIHENHKLKKGTIKLLATVGEEKEQFGSQQVYEKGYTEDLDALIIAEPSENILVYGHKGSMDIRVTSKGVPCHSSAPFLGKSAITPLLSFINRIEQEYKSELANIRSKSLDFSNLFKEIEKHEQEIEGVSKETVLNNISGPVISNTIINGGNQINSIPDKAYAEFNVRTIPEYDNTRIKELFQRHVDEVNKSEDSFDLSMDVYLDLNPVITTGENDLVSMAVELAEEHFGIKVKKSPTLGVTDASNLLRGKDEKFPFIMLGPGTNPHQTNEYVDRNTYLKFIEYYIDLMTSYLSN